MENKSVEREMVSSLRMVHNKVISPGGRVVLKYTDLADAVTSLLPMSWNHEITAATQAVVNSGYIANNVTTVTLTLPATAVVGDLVGIVGKGAGGWIIQGNAGQYIHSGPAVTISGGQVKSLHYKDSCTLVCITENTDWAVIWSNGNLGVEVS